MSAQATSLTLQDEVAEGLRDAAARYGTPLYVYDLPMVSLRCHQLVTALHSAHERIAATTDAPVLLYAMKANANRRVLERVLAAGFGCECVSMYECAYAVEVVSRMRTAGQLTAHRTPLLFTHSNVSDEELAHVVDMRTEALERASVEIFINADSLHTLTRLPSGTRCFLRVNGGSGGGHHAHVITAGPASKFGIPAEDVPQACALARSRGLRLVGVHQHIGSGIRDAHTYVHACDVLARVVAHNAGHLPDLQYVNFGGGIGVAYHPDAAAPVHTCTHVQSLADGVMARFAQLCADVGRPLTLMLEPGRFPVAECGYLVCRVTSLKSSFGRQWMGVDSGFNHLVRPLMYGSYHHLSALHMHAAPADAQEEYHVAGNVCESGDVFTRAEPHTDACTLEHVSEPAPRVLPRMACGDLLVVHTCGAYGFAMSSEYNMRPRPAEAVLEGVEDGGARRVVLARPRTTLQQMLGAHLAEGVEGT